MVQSISPLVLSVFSAFSTLQWLLLPCVIYAGGDRQTAWTRAESMTMHRHDNPVRCFFYGWCYALIPEQTVLQAVGWHLVGWQDSRSVQQTLHMSGHAASGVRMTTPCVHAAHRCLATVQNPYASSNPASAAAIIRATRQRHPPAAGCGAVLSALQRWQLDGSDCDAGSWPAQNFMRWGRSPPFRPNRVARYACSETAVCLQTGSL